MRKFLVIIGVMFVFECCCLPSARAEYRRLNEPYSDDPMAVAIFELDNGLMVYLSENHQTPHFYAEIALRTGAKFDPSDTTGLAHYMEHLLFKGTRTLGTLDYEKEKIHLDRITELYEKHFNENDPVKRKEIYAAINAESQNAARYAIPNEFSKVYEVMGGSWLNAHTGFEQIVYKIKLPSNRLRQWAAIESDRFRYPVFRLFQTELETVYEEKNRLLDDKYWIMQEAVLHKLFKRHPYGQYSIIGSVEHLKNPSLHKLYSFYETYYVPNNMAIIISGDIDIDETIRIIDEYFSVWESKRLPRPKQWREKPLQGIERVHVNYLGEEYVLLAFRTARFKHRDFERLVILDTLLGDSHVGLIALNLVLPQKVRSAGSYAHIYNDYGVQFVWGVPKEGQTLEEVKDLLVGEIERIKEGAFTQGIIDDIVTNIKIEYKRGLESNDQRVSMIRDSFVTFISWKHWLGYLRRLEKVRKGHIVQIAKKYFRDNYVAGYRHDQQHEIPAIQKPDLAPIDIDPKRQSEFAKQVLAMPVEEIEPEFVDSNTDYSVLQDAGGITYYYTQNPLNDLFTLSISVDVGVRQDNRIGPAVGFLKKSGTTSLSPQELKKKWYGLGCRFAISVQDDETIITIAGLDENFEASFALLKEVLLESASDEATLSEFKAITRVERRDMKKNLSSIMDALNQFNLYDQESGYLNVLPLTALETMSVDDLHDVIKNLLTYKHTISYVGSRSFTEVQEIIKRHMKVDEALRDLPVYHHRRVRTADTTVIYFFDKEMAQTHISVEFAGQEYNEAVTPLGQLFNYYFGGMSGVVFQELRESRALAYSAWGYYDFGYRKGAQNVARMGIATQADKTIEALQAMVRLIDEIRLTPEQFSEARTSIINHYRIAKIKFREVVEAVRKWERLGLPPDPRRERFNMIKALKIGQLQEFHQKEIAHHPKLISIVGDKNKIDMEALQAVGRIVFIDLDDIFLD